MTIDSLKCSVWRLAEKVRIRKRRRIDDLVDQFAQLPVLDQRTDDEIVGYDGDGLPK